MVAAQHQGDAARIERGARFSRDGEAYVRNRTQKTGATLRTAFGILAQRHVNVARVLNGVPEAFEARAKIGVAYGERPHVDAATAGAKVHGDADDANGSHGLRVMRRRESGRGAPG